MIRMGLFLTIIIVTINSGLFLTGDIQDQSVFTNLSEQLNQFQEVGAAKNIIPQKISIFGVPSEVQEFGALIVSMVASALAILGLITFLLIGGINVIQLIDPNSVWGLLVLAPLAAFQIFYIVFMLLTILSGIAGLLLRRGAGG